MRGSAVVQGLKSLASKLHPQLPLSPKESQRLLTALTTSFRQQLDQAHPRQAGSEEGRPKPGNGGVWKTGAQQLHSSSAAFADRHLASVLTNPLLAKGDGTKKPILDYESAKIELQKNPATDPISLLEEYDEKGAATVPIALLCLERFKQTVDNLPEEKQQDEILRTKAAKRTLLWLWKNNLHETDAFVENFKFIDSMMSLLVNEGSEEYFWEWFQMDMTLGSQSGSVANINHGKYKHYRYRWKGRLLRALAHAKLKGSKDKSANAALDVLFRACDLKEMAINRGLDGSQYPLNPTAVLIVRTLEHSVECCANTDPARFARYMERVLLYYGEEVRYREWQIARLWLVRPRNPSPLPALRVLKSVLERPSEDTVYGYFARPRDDKSMLNNYFFMVRTAALLHDHARTEEANWVLCRTREIFPTLARFLEGDLDDELKRYRGGAPRAFSPTNEVEDVTPRRILFPSFT